jgi:hypothetical protein
METLLQKHWKILTSAAVFLASVSATVSYVSAADLAVVVAPQTSTASGSNGSRVSVGTGGVSTDLTASGETSYYNHDSDATIVGNSLRGYYYDSQLGFFQLNWSSNPNRNVRFVASTSKCSTGYGYRMDGYAYGKYGGLIDFGYSSDISVYYCESDGKLHGHAYSESTGFQSFEGIEFNIWSGIRGITGTAPTSSGNTSDPFFVNNSTVLLDEVPIEVKNSIVQGEKASTYWGDESVFYIVK